MIEIRRYNATEENAWNDLLVKSKNGVFLFNRSYMDYHADRFTDHSLIVYKKGIPWALFPANEKGNEIVSHGGLTFGGLVYSTDNTAQAVLDIFLQIASYYKKAAFSSITYKAVPYIFHKYPAAEDLYALFRLNAQLIRRDISSVVGLNQPIRFSETKRQAITKCKKLGVTLSEAASPDEYWKLLSSVLSKFDTRPVHSIEEFRLLQSRFPGKIKLYEARLNEQLLAGIVVYDYENVVHTQYMANAEQGRKIGALDFINSHLINEVYNDRQHYSFGISTENNGQLLNEGLILQKEMMGGRGVALDFYKISL